MTIYLDKEHRKTKEKATEIARDIIATSLGDIAETEAYIDPELEAVVVKLDSEMMKERGVDLEKVPDLINIANYYELSIESDQLIIKPKK